MTRINSLRVCANAEDDTKSRAKKTRSRRLSARIEHLSRGPRVHGAITPLVPSRP
jgi:hypothetical protein